MFQQVIVSEHFVPSQQKRFSLTFEHRNPSSNIIYQQFPSVTALHFHSLNIKPITVGMCFNIAL